MKIKANIFNYLVFTSFLLLSAHATNLRSNLNIHPNVGEITNEYHKMVKPFYQKEFFPEEVDSIKEPAKPAYEFTKAEIVGSQEKGGELDQKPTIYETVVSRHGTSVVHPVPKPGSFASQSAGALFSQNPVKEYPVQEIRPGQYAIPVKLETRSTLMNQANLKGYENPEIKKSQYEINKLTDNNQFGDNILMTQLDINKISTKVRQAKTNKDKIKILKQGRKTLEKEASSLSNWIQKDVAELLNSKGLALNMNSILAKYEGKLKKSQMSRLKLSDVITIKKKLIKKLIKEVQGYRTSSSDYKEITKVSGNDIKRIIRKIKRELKY